MKVSFFGQLTDVVANEQVEIEDAGTTDELIRQLVRSYPALEKMKYVIAIDKKIVNGNVPLFPGSEIALLPPFSGG